MTYIRFSLDSYILWEGYFFFPTFITFYFFLLFGFHSGEAWKPLLLFHHYATVYYLSQISYFLQNFRKITCNILILFILSLAALQKLILESTGISLKAFQYYLTTLLWYRFWSQMAPNDINWFNMFDHLIYISRV
jgi:hypothetical protein